VNPRKWLKKALSSPANLRFEEACALARAFGFHLSRVSGSHRIFGVNFPTDKEEVTDYLAGMMVPDESHMPDGLEKRNVRFILYHWNPRHGSPR
jgi:hypothetical protein